jgi:hypothetical protein
MLAKEARRSWQTWQSLPAFGRKPESKPGDTGKIRILANPDQKCLRRETAAFIFLENTWGRRYSPPTPYFFAPPFSKICVP